MKNFKVNKLCSLMTLISAAALPISTASYASDLTIYKGGTKGKTSILLMLDTSGSMGISSLVLPTTNIYGSPGDVNATACKEEGVSEAGGNMPGNVYEYQYSAVDNRAQVKKDGKLVANSTSNGLTKGKTSFYKEVIINGKTVPYYIRGCGTAYVDDNGRLVESGNNRFDRLSRLKDAILSLLEDPTALEDTIRIGLGHFSSKTDLFVGKTDSTRKIPLVDGHSGSILLPVGELTPAHRLALAEKIAEFTSIDTTTDQTGSRVENQKYSSQKPPLTLKASSGTPTAHAYAEAGAYMMGTQTRSQTHTGDVKFIYDGTSFIVNENAASGQPKQVYYICVAVGNGTTNGLGYSGNVKQCVNAWPTQNSVSGRSLTNAAKDTIRIPYNNNWLNLTGRYSGAEKTAVDAAKAQLDKIQFDNPWDAYTKLPSGWSYGGWMKVDQQPMDIEPIAGLAWQSYNIGNTQYFRNLVSYRASPFTLDGTNENNAGGFKYSADSTKTDNKAKYKAGGSTSSCDGNGIYFLTDGAPNSTKDSMARTILNDTLTTTLTTGSPAGTYGFSSKPTGAGVLVSPDLQSGLFSGETGGWEYIGEYAKRLRNRTDTSNTQKNPADMNIKTAVVGFGASFSGIRQPDGTYNCEVVKNSSPDAYNACLWGSPDHGDGGFYFAENADDIKKSIVDFVEKARVDFTATSLGTISIPLDPLDQTKAMSTGFFPMVEPVSANDQRTWLGNLKKYYVLNGTLTDSATGGNAVYKLVDNQQVINENAKEDIWFKSNRSLSVAGGALDKIPVPANFTVANNPINNTSSTRNVFVVSGNALKKVTKSNLATNLATDQALGTTTEFPMKQRIALLNYLGYAFPLSPLPAELLGATINALPVPNLPYRYLGGVVHSTPLVVTKEATLNSNDQITKREEYVVYGSMDGGLHIVDAETGLEKSVFVPQEVLDQQPETLAGPNAAGRLAYGVDAPWTADNTFKITSSTSSGTTSTKYIARSMNIYGGLRMGGRAIYGLNIEDPSKPKLLFHKTPSSTGFERLGQIWSKPVITNIRVKGEVKKVLIFGGGYDETVFENDAEKTVVPNGPTAGNALYIVDAANGNLIWSVSSNNTGTGKTNKQQKQADVKFSVVGQPAVRDYNADGLTDVIYFADLGGQVFRVDLNNAAQASANADNNIAVRTQTLARLATASFTPRFYERPSTAVFKEGQKRFVLVTLGSGNRSYPLEKEPGLNQVYGLLDWDAAAKNLEKDSFTPATVIDSTNLVTTGILGKTQSQAITASEAIALKNGSKRGWSFALKTEAGSSNNGYVKAMEETQLIKDDLYVSVYDPQAALGNQTINSCGGGIQGLSTMHRICMPYGNCAAYATTDNQGIIGVPLGSVSSSDPRKTQIVSPSPITAEKCVGEGCGTVGTDGTIKPTVYSQSRAIRPIRWYEQ